MKAEAVRRLRFAADKGEVRGCMTEFRPEDVNALLDERAALLSAARGVFREFAPRSSASIDALLAAIAKADAG